MFGQIATTLTFTEILPSTKTIASFKVPDYNSGKVGSCLSYAEIFFMMMILMFKSFYLLFILQLEIQYFHDHATFTTTIGLNQTPGIDVTATIGTPAIAFGAEAGYDATSGNFTKYTAGISVAKPDSCASIIL